MLQNLLLGCFIIFIIAFVFLLQLDTKSYEGFRPGCYIELKDGFYSIEDNYCGVLTLKSMKDGHWCKVDLHKENIKTRVTTRVFTNYDPARQTGVDIPEVKLKD